MMKTLKILLALIALFVLVVDVSSDERQSGGVNVLAAITYFLNAAIIADLFVRRRWFTRVVYTLATLFLMGALAPHILRTMGWNVFSFAFAAGILAPYAWVAFESWRRGQGPLRTTA